MRVQKALKNLLFAFSIFAFISTLISCSMVQKNPRQEISDGTPSVPQGPAITLQEEHDLRDSNKFDRFTEHFFNGYILQGNPRQKEKFNQIDKNLKVKIKNIDIIKTENYLTEFNLNLEVSNKGNEILYIYDLIFDKLEVGNLEPSQRLLIDKATENFVLQPGEKKDLHKKLELPWFQRSEPEKLDNTSNFLEMQVVVSEKNIDVDQFFIEAKKALNIYHLPEALQVLNLIEKRVPIQKKKP